jgi:2-iminobutanoate/2-iminopropanoate deaminase
MRFIYSLFLLIVVSITSCGTKEDVKPVSKVVFHKTHEAKKANAPFSDVVQVGDL